MYTKPFLKWVGGKGRLVAEIMKRLPRKWDGYFEPFLGGGAVYFFLASTYAARTGMRWMLGDVNEDLVNAFGVTMHNSTPLFRLLKLHRSRHSEDYFYRMRKQRQPTSILKAARFIYLNRTCFNGLYRVNRAGEFNVPFGRYKDPLNLAFFDSLRLASVTLRKTKPTIRVAPFWETIDMAMKHDFVYCDPPYLPKTETADFTAYHKDKFGLGEHEQLRDALAAAHKRGVKWMLSEGDSKVIRTLFKDFNVMPVKGRQSVAASGDSRDVSRELLITNYKDFKDA